MRSILSLENCTRAEVLEQFSREKSKELTDQQDMFYYKIVNHSDVLGALPIGAASNTSSSPA